MRKKIVLWGIATLFVGVVLGLTHDIIFTNILAYQICKADPNPKTFIKRAVYNPGSIYWEDNIYPGFNEEDRLLMIRNYLDGVHLTTMALNGPDGKIYLYTATEKDWQTSLGMEKKSEEDWKKYFKTIETEARTIASRVNLLNRKELSQINYNVVFNPVSLTNLQRRYLYSDEVIITDNKKDEIIAYNRRLMRFYYKLQLEPIGGCTSMTKLYFKEMYGMPLPYGLDDQSILRYTKPSNIVTNYKCRRSLKSRL